MRKKQYRDLTGQQFNNWTVIEYVGNNKHGKAMWLCECNCKNKTKRNVVGGNLVSGISKSCGCRKEKYNDLEKMIAQRFAHIKQRCYNPNNIQYHNYGERGIRICDEWLNDTSKFVEWAIDNGFKKHLTIERINVNGNYEPNNCRWIPRADQALNMRKTLRVEENGKVINLAKIARKANTSAKVLVRRYNNGVPLKDITKRQYPSHTVFITYNGETHCINEWGRITGVDRRMISYRLQNGWDVSELFLPPNSRYYKK